MKRMNRILFLFCLLTSFATTTYAQINCDICTTGGTTPIAIERQARTTPICTDTLPLCLNQATQFTTTAVAGATYAWSVIGANIQIIGDRDQATVIVSASQAGYYTICLTKSVNGQAPCCVCKTVYVSACGGGGAAACPPCPLKMIMTAPPCYNTTQSCIWRRGNFQVVCQDGSTLTNWITSNNVTGQIVWETVSGNGGFNGPTCDGSTELGTPPNGCGFQRGCYDLGYNMSSLQSPWWCHCSELTFTPYITLRATITFTKNGVTCTKVVTESFIVTENCPPGNRTTGEELTVTPNPSNGDFVVKIVNKAEQTLQAVLTGADGTIIKTIVAGKFAAGTQTISVRRDAKMLPGTYYVTLYANGQAAGSTPVIIK